ncbi:hypothetical protein SAMN06265219_105192 [Gracilimonas mengyeensis]|uniref:Uncharacterized protein n=1 Tax=Gracilimonas mengyeensis TaxID=1302730 RepID=A0A521CKK2_9BACT|nr:hypothetical protein SAMN06265219_105192 [Gracilimonas mengyeensis]
MKDGWQRMQVSNRCFEGRCRKIFVQDSNELPFAAFYLLYLLLKEEDAYTKYELRISTAAITSLEHFLSF